MLTQGQRPGARADFFKGHGLGNDYLVFEEGDAWVLTPEAVRRVCDRWTGVGGDGIVLLLGRGADGVCGLRMFNPDGSEFERSGNGLRILAAFLARGGRVGTEPFRVRVGGDEVELTVHARSGSLYDVSVDMGRASVGPRAVGLDPSALDRHGRFPGPSGEALDIVPVSVGNPHLVVLGQPPSEDVLLRLGPYLEAHPALARGANVQLASKEAPGVCGAMIWERGVGRTTASGTSSCAVAVAMVHRGLQAPGSLTVRQDGGELYVTVSSEGDVVLRGPVEDVLEGRLLGLSSGGGS
jgi:diaminopimelate epimerase